MKNDHQAEYKSPLFYNECLILCSTSYIILCLIFSVIIDLIALLGKKKWHIANFNWWHIKCNRKFLFRPMNLAHLITCLWQVLIWWGLAYTHWGNYAIKSTHTYAWDFSPLLALCSRKMFTWISGCVFLT